MIQNAENLNMELPERNSCFPMTCPSFEGASGINKGIYYSKAQVASGMEIKA